uniref:Transmembrane protein n=1 Tax=Loa loa TaxID=7209 RepID=A0A1I7V909_LOALO
MSIDVTLPPRVHINRLAMKLDVMIQPIGNYVVWMLQHVAVNVITVIGVKYKLSYYQGYQIRDYKNIMATKYLISD